MGQMTRLDAVNQCLLAAGEAIVADLNNLSGVDTSIAEYLLDSYTNDFQMRGLANNEYTTDLDIQPSGQIFLPHNIISLDFLSVLTNEKGEVIRVSIKKEGTSYLLWNVTDQTDIWTPFDNLPIRAKFIVDIEWEDIDTPGQRAITSSAARRYQMLTQGDGEMDAYLMQDEQMYNFKGKARDQESKGRTIWDAAGFQKTRAVFRPAGNFPTFRSWRGRSS